MLSTGGAVTALVCAHAFHTHCLQEWRQVQGITNMAKCPLNCHRSMAVDQPGGIPEMFRRGHGHRQADDGWEVVDDEAGDAGANSDDGTDRFMVEGSTEGGTAPGGGSESDPDDDVVIH